MTQRLQHALDDVTRRYSEAGYFPSACVRVFDSYETLAVSTCGEATQDALFDVASLTKLATATQILHLISCGTLSLAMTLPELFPEIQQDPVLAARCRDISLYRLLTHTSSLPAWYPFYVHKGEDFFAVFRKALDFEGTTEGVVYSDLNFMLLGRLLVQVRKKPLEDCLREDLVEPLQLGKMTYLPRTGPIIPSCMGNPIEAQMVRDRGLTFDGFRPLGMPVVGSVNDGNSHYYFGDVAGHAGIFATAHAYEKLCRYYMRTQDALLLTAQAEQPDAPGRGLGFQTGISYPYGCGHTGFTGTSVYFSREKNIGAVIFTNRLFYPVSNPHLTGDFRRVVHEMVCALA